MRSGGNVGGPDGPSFDKEAKGGEGHLGGGPHILEVVGLGSGGFKGITLAAKESLEEADVVFGYGLYMDQAKPYVSKAEMRQSGMTAEMKRAEEAIAAALSGRRVAMVSGGDAGVYAMAGAVFEVAAAKKVPLGVGPGRLDIRVKAGIPAFVESAALLGAPLTHDFCAVSLSDRLTPWELIEKRLTLAAQGDFVISLYNPKSHGRDWQLGRAAELILEHRDLKTPTGLVSRAGREGESAVIITLAELSAAPVDMQTLVMIGNSSTFVYEGRMITPRGYVNKYSSAD